MSTVYVEKIENNRLGNTTPFASVAASLGWTIVLDDDEIETAYDGSKWLAGHAPVKPVELDEQALRTERDRRITACDWVITRHRDEVDEGGDTTLSTGEYTAWLVYRKALRDLPSADGFPWDGGGEETPWPTEPVA